MANVNIICWANGLLELSDTIPDGSLPLARVEEKLATETLNALATLSYNDEWLVPKSMEWVSALADGDKERAEQEAYNSMMDFRARLVCTLEKAGKDNGEE